MKTVYTILGARPQFIKAAAVSRALRSSQFCSSLTEKVIHTGQHYDANMSDIFFSELDMHSPDWQLNCGTGTHGEMTAKMLTSLEKLFLQNRPDAVLVYGDTNSTLAGALAAIKLNIPILHVESGLRSFNRRMPEEINRILTDKISKRLYCPTQSAINNLRNEGFTDEFLLSGDVMYDICLSMSEKSDTSSTILKTLELESKTFALVTMHRAENTDDDARLVNLVSNLERLSKNIRVIFPVHPRTKQKIKSLGLDQNLNHATLIEPVGYLDLLQLAKNSKVIITDSGGLQKEAYFLKTPCVTLRDETEWTETLINGWNILFDPMSSDLLNTVNSLAIPSNWLPHYGKGNASEIIAQDIYDTLYMV